MNKKFAGLWVVLGLILVPSLALAQFTDFEGSITTLTEWINSIIPLLIGIAVLVFLWGVIKYVIAGDDAESRKQGLGLMAYGILAIFVMVSVWGLVNVLINTFSLETAAPTDIPEVPGR